MARNPKPDTKSPQHKTLPSLSSGPDNVPIEEDDLPTDQDEQLTFNGPVLGRTLQEQIVLSFILANPTKAEMRETLPSARLEMQRDRLAIGMTALFGVQHPKSRRKAPDDPLLYQIAAALKHERAKHRLPPSSKEIDVLPIIRKVVSEAYRDFEPSAASSAISRLRKNFSKQQEKWEAMVEFVNFEAETLQFQILKTLEELLKNTGVEISPVKWSNII